jgi:hypothetical protein
MKKSASVDSFSNIAGLSNDVLGTVGNAGGVLCIYMCEVVQKNSLRPNCGDHSCKVQKMKETYKGYTACAYLQGARGRYCLAYQCCISAYTTSYYTSQKNFDANGSITHKHEISSMI